MNCTWKTMTMMNSMTEVFFSRYLSLFSCLSKKKKYTVHEWANILHIWSHLLHSLTHMFLECGRKSRVPGENAHKHRENMQIPHMGEKFKPSTSELWGRHFNHSVTMLPLSGIFRSRFWKAIELNSKYVAFGRRVDRFNNKLMSYRCCNWLDDDIHSRGHSSESLLHLMC